jgi:hypothetical protein
MKTFKKITVGGISKEQLLQDLTQAGIQFNKYANILFEHPSFCPPVAIEHVDLVKLAPADFGFSNSFSYQELVRQASMCDLDLCPLYLAAFLRLQYLDQPAGAHLTVASERPSGEWPNGFYIRNFENILWLRGYQADDFCDWPDQNEFNFRRRS